MFAVQMYILHKILLSV